MIWFAILFSSATTILLAVLLYAMPSITSPTLPLDDMNKQGLLRLGPRFK